MDFDTLTAVLLVTLGGLFGWVLGKLPERWVYVIAAAALIVGIIVVSRATGTS